MRKEKVSLKTVHDRKKGELVRRDIINIIVVFCRECKCVSRTRRRADYCRFKHFGETSRAKRFPEKLPERFVPTK